MAACEALPSHCYTGRVNLPRPLLAFVPAFFVLASLPAALADDWPQWRGPNRDGKSAETGFLRRWPGEGPPLAWKTNGLGEGFSSLAVVDGKVFTQGQRGGQTYVMAFDEATGEKLWETPNGSRYSNRRGNGPRGTPAVENGRAYALGADGNLIAVSTEDGKKLWESNLLERFNGRNISWGISESPLIDGDRLIVNPGGPGASVAALNKNDGSLIWKSGDGRAGYSAPMLAGIGGVRHYIVLNDEAGLGLRADDGKVLWRYERVANSTANIATPIVHNGHVFLSTDYGTGCALLKLEASGDEINAKEVYFNRDMRNHYSTSVLVDGYLYGFNSRILTAMKWDTGEVVWRSRSVGKGQLIYADGHLYVFSEGGVAGLVQATPEEYREKSRFEIDSGRYPTWTLPVIANGKLYLREQDNLYCYNIQDQ